MPFPATPNYTSMIRVVNTNAPSFEETSNNLSLAYQLSSQNASLEEIFQCINELFPEACILTLEGGHCKKPPMVRHFSQLDQLDDGQVRSLPRLNPIRTVILKGSWNLMREDCHFHTLAASFPNVREWHITYAKPKSKAYLSKTRNSS